MNVKLGVNDGKAQLEFWLTSDKITVRRRHNDSLQ